jgi:hypothetical protein
LNAKKTKKAIAILFLMALLAGVWTSDREGASMFGGSRSIASIEKKSGIENFKFQDFQPSLVWEADAKDKNPVFEVRMCGGKCFTIVKLDCKGDSCEPFWSDGSRLSKYRFTSTKVANGKKQFRLEICEYDALGVSPASRVEIRDVATGHINAAVRGTQDITLSDSNHCVGQEAI